MVHFDYAFNQRKSDTGTTYTICCIDGVVGLVEDIENLPVDVRAELIDGQIFYFAAPMTIHQRLSKKIFRTLDRYIEENHGDCEAFYAPIAIRLIEDGKNHLEPDVIRKK